MGVICLGLIVAVQFQLEKFGHVIDDPVDCVMGNHFHAKVEAPVQKRWVEEQFGGPQGEERLMRHLRVLYSKVFVEQLQEECAELRKRGSEAVVQHRLGLLKRRFCDVAVFLKEVKQRFSRWYNKRHKRKGTLWMDRYRSVLVNGGGGNPLLEMVAYIVLFSVGREVSPFGGCGAG